MLRQSKCRAVDLRIGVSTKPCRIKDFEGVSPDSCRAGRDSQTRLLSSIDPPPWPWRNCRVFSEGVEISPTRSKLKFRDR